MIVCAALKVNFDNVKKVIVPRLRHRFGFAELADLGVGKNCNIEQGFVTNNNEFLNRKEALIHAKQCGQLSRTTLWTIEDEGRDELFSEDLY